VLTIDDIKNFELEHFSQINESNYEVLTHDYLAWIMVKHDEMDPDAQQYSDTVFTKLLKSCQKKIEAMVEGPGKRQTWRTYKKATGEHHDIVILFRTLETLPANSDPRAMESEDLILKYLQHLSDVLFDVKENIESCYIELIYLSLFYACIDEILASLHLARHHFYVQTNAHLRTIIETLDKVDLFTKDPSMIDVWKNGDYQQKQKHLSPSATRKKLGKDGYDEIYNFFCEHGTHPTFRSLQDRVVQMVNENPRKQIRIWYAGTPFEPHMISFYTFALNLVTRTLMKAIDFGAKYLNEQEMYTIFDDIKKDIIKFHEDIVIPWAKENDLDHSEFTDYFSK